MEEDFVKQLASHQIINFADKTTTNTHICLPGTVAFYHFLKQNTQERKKAIYFFKSRWCNVEQLFMYLGWVLLTMASVRQ